MERYQIKVQNMLNGVDNTLEEVLWDSKLNNNSKPLKDIILTEELNKTDILTFTKPMANKVNITKLGSTIKILNKFGTIIFEGRAIDGNSDFYNEEDFNCYGVLDYFKDTIIEPFEFHDISVSNFLKWIIDRHNEQCDTYKVFYLGNVTVKDNNNSIYRKSEKHIKSFECLQTRLIDELGGYFKVRYKDGKKYLDYLDKSGENNTQYIQFGKNLLDLEQFINTSELCTIVVPVGKDNLTISSVNGGKNYIENTNLINIYGKIKKVVEWSDITDAGNLLKKGQEYSKKQALAVTISLKAIDFNLLNDNIERFKLGDYVRVISKQHGLNTYMQITKKITHIDNPAMNEIVLGFIDKTLIEQQHNVDKNINQIAINIDSINKNMNQIEIENANTMQIANKIASYNALNV